MAKVVFKDIVKNYGTQSVLKNVNLEVEDGEFVALLGPSGCGKSTLLRMTAGLEELASGQISVDGERMDKVHPRNRNIAMVFQSYALYPQMKVFDNIAFSMQVKKLPKPEIREKVHWAADILNIRELLERFPGQLSGGQRQRVAMGRAIVRNPKVFLFDEPLSNLDAKLRERMRFEVRKIHNRLKATTIYVTHDQIEAMTMADKIIVMRDGTVQQAGTPAEVFDRPANIFVAGFIGTPAINFLQGRLKKGADQPVFCCGEMEIPLPAGLPDPLPQNVICGVRPQNVTLEGESNVHGTAPAKLVLFEMTGTETHCRFQLEDTEITLVAQGRLDLQQNREYRLGFDPEKLHLFDAETETRLN